MNNASQVKQGAVFLDRDGVINEKLDFYVKSWDEFHFIPGALKAIHDLAELPWPILIITNQSVVGRKMITREALEEIHFQMLRCIRSAGGRIDGIYVCPHTPDAGCQCRKPQIGLLLKAEKEWDLDLKGSLMIGDSLSDMQAAQAVSMPFIFSGQINQHLLYSEIPARWASPEPIIGLERIVEQLIARYQNNPNISRAADMVYSAK